MTTKEFSNQFDTLVDSYRRFKDFDRQQILDSIEFDEYEKSVYLTMAQDELVVNFYNGKNIYGEAFEDTEEMRRYLDVLVKTSKPNEVIADESGSGSDDGYVGVSSNSVFYELPSDILFIVYEQAKLSDSGVGCYNGSLINVQPALHDEYNRIRKNPFRGPTRYRILRLDAGQSVVELVSKYSFTDYMIRYIAKPSPIILEDIAPLSIRDEHKEQDCHLNSILHDIILKRAVQMALASKGISVNS